MLRCRLTEDPDGRIVLESPYGDFAPVLDAFKAQLPWDGRAWDSQRKRWLISALYATELLAFLQRHNATVQDDRDSLAGDARQGPVEGILIPVPPMPPDLQDAFTVLRVMPNAPLGLCEAAYKFLAKVWHPDLGGQAQDFQRLNDAMATIRRYLAPIQETPNVHHDIPF